MLHDDWLEHDESHGVSGFIYLILVLIAIVWLLSILCVYRVYPNLLSTTIFVYKALAHWALVSILMMLFYGWSFLPLQMYGRVVGALFPLIVALYVCGDVLVLVRRRLFVVIATANAATITERIGDGDDLETGQSKDATAN